MKYLFSLASITRIPLDNPLIILFLIGKFIFSGFVPNGNYATPVFDSATWEDISEEMKEAGMAPDGKVELHDGLNILFYFVPFHFL